MRKMRLVFALLLFVIIAACSEEQVQGDSSPENTSVQNSIGPGAIVINEFCFKAQTENEFGDESDWIELYNTTVSDILLEAGQWTISDKEDNPQKYFIPEVVIPADDYLILWCDGEDIMGEDIHTNFKLSAKGETIVLYFGDELMDLQTYDSTGTSQDFTCKCRRKDGGEEWSFSNDPTPMNNNSDSF